MAVRSKKVRQSDRDTMRPEYDFSKGVRGTTAARYAQGTNVMVIDPAVVDIFPDEESVNEALHILAALIRRRKRPRSKAR